MVAGNVPHLARSNQFKRDKGFFKRIKKVNTFVSANPYGLFTILVQTKNRVTADAGAIAQLVAKKFKNVTIKAVKSVAAAKPHKAFFILQNGGNGIAG